MYTSMYAKNAWVDDCMYGWVGGCMDFWCFDVLMYAFLDQVNVANKDGRFNCWLSKWICVASLPISSNFTDLVTFPALWGLLRKSVRNRLTEKPWENSCCCQFPRNQKNRKDSPKLQVFKAANITTCSPKWYTVSVTFQGCFNTEWFVKQTKIQRHTWIMKPS